MTTQPKHQKPQVEGTHTPAPWTVNHDDGETIGILGNAGNNARGQQYIAAVHYSEAAQAEYLPGTPSHEQAKANARLIAAAPELLEACMSFVSIINNACEMDEKVLRLSELDTQYNLARAAIAKATGGN